MATVEEFLSREEIKQRVDELGEKITSDYDGQSLVLIGILKGAFVFLSDLARAIDSSRVDVKIEFMVARSYGDATESSGVVQITQDLTKPIDGENVIIVEDIVDTGLTAKYLLENLATRNPNSLKFCSLLEKPSKSKGIINIDYLGFSIDDKFVVGYGLDYAQRYRNLPHIGVLHLPNS